MVRKLADYPKKKKMISISKTKVIGVICILCMVLVVMIAISESESMSLNEHSSDDEIEDEIVERFERAAGKDHEHHKKHHHKHDKNKKNHHKPKNGTVSDNSNKTESMYANKKTDVNEKAKVTGMKSQKPGKHAHVKAVEVADEGSKTGVIVAVVLVLITVLGVGAAVFIVKKKRAQGKS
ncbi:uncharacterized protein [Magallana gigas]|nr:uncharacterized protein LOC105321313 isoform X1 [Crassostrea gigas]XP_034331319.1 uncharacterized protein LOC105321313 isoform X1 [Crassostrea gigas]